MNEQYITIQGAKQNNLQNINLKLPLNKMTVITGVSGSGKSSLAFDTIYAEGQRRYVETFSSYARQFLQRMDKPKVDKIEGIPPAIAIDQTNPVRSSRSTVGTMSEINDHLKLLFSRTAHLVCKECGKRVNRDSPQTIAGQLEKTLSGQDVVLTFRVNIPHNFSAQEVKELLQAQGYTRIMSEDSNGYEIIQDRLKISPHNRTRLIEDLEAALKNGNGKVSIHPGSGKTIHFSSGLHCPDCDITYKDSTPGLFSFNSPIGACETCRGFGRIIDFDLDLVIPEKFWTLSDGVIKPFQTASFHECQEDLIRFARKCNIPVDVAWRDLDTAHQEWVIEGEGSWEEGKWYGVRGFFKWLESKSYKMHIRVLLSRYRTYQICPSCNGARLKPEALLWRLGEQNYTVHDIAQLPISDSFSFFEKLRKDYSFDEATGMVLKEICTRLRYLVDVGLGYLTLDRQSRTLSGGEVQRINLTTALGTSLVNTLFILDEPSIGLHSRDIRRLIGILHNLRDAGNTLLVVEHDPELIRAADHVIDMGPGPGEHGGNIVFSGNLPEMLKSGKSLTSEYLRKKVKINPGKDDSSEPSPAISIKGASEHNLRNIDVDIPLNRIVCVTGVSGSGKSTLVNDICYYGLRRLLRRPVEKPGKHDSIEGYRNIDWVIMADQTPIGRTTRSNPVSYIGAFDRIRKYFVSTPLAKERGYTPGVFSFNAGPGRCPSCRGNGFEHIEMQFLSDIYLRCPDCDGKRYRKEILEVKLDIRGESRSISDVLDMTAEQAVEFFKDDWGTSYRIQKLIDVGLSYIRLGQPLSTLSGGEAQRLKLAKFLADCGVYPGKGTLFLFDEPTTGLHFADIEILVNTFRTLVEAGNSVVIIEHNLDVIGVADWIIDLGPEGGEKGGQVVFTGAPDQIIKCKNNHTGRALAEYLKFDIKREVTQVKEETQSPVDSSICIRKAREHNLQNIDLGIPRDSLTVITGVSGSGKSTVAFDILFAEGQRRYLESLNAYARQFVQPASRPDVDSVAGIPPAVAIEQRTSRGGRKSTVATITEIYHFLRLLFVKTGIRHCPDCNLPIAPKHPDAILSDMLRDFSGKKVAFYAPLVINRKGIYADLAKWAESKGFLHLRVDGELKPVNNWARLDRYKEHSIELPVGELRISAEKENALCKMINRTLDFGKGTLIAETANTARFFSTLQSCPRCSRSFGELDPRLFSFNSKHGWCPECFGTGLQISGFDEEQTGEEIWWNEWYEGGEQVCPSCNGKRLNSEALSVYLDGKNISEYTALTIRNADELFRKMKFSGRDAEITAEIIPELLSRLDFLKQVGLEYITLDRAAPTLSGGEAQRIRLAAQLGSNLRGVCYILDEPTIGLHARDNRRLLDTLFSLKKKGNTVVVVEHDEETIRSAEHIIDLGPGGGKNGGKLLARGSIDDIIKNKNSITGKYLREPLPHSMEKRSIRDAEWITIHSASMHNLKGIDVRFPTGKIVCVTGVSGSGKSTLVRDIFYQNIKEKLSSGKAPAIGCKEITGWESVSRILEVDQRPIGKTPRSCPATYVGFMDDIRKLFSRTPEAIMRGYTPSRFSFNVEQGRCSECKGQGIKTIEMSFLPDVNVTCEVCGGSRFTPETTEIRFKGKSISDVLSMNVDEAVEFFSAHHSIHSSLKLLQETGLGYLTLGQQSPTLSGGEAQRIKLVTELGKAVSTKPLRGSRKARNHTVYVLDEPTVGLHIADIDKLIQVLHRLVDAGNSVVIIEHNMDIIAEADWIIDLGPEGGDGGGRIVAQGTPARIIRSKSSHTAAYLRSFLEERERNGRKNNRKSLS